MGRRPEPRTSAEIKAEMEYAKKKEKQTENQYKLLLNKYRTEKRNERTRRLCTEAGILEHFVPELAEMDEDTAADFIKTAAASREAVNFLQIHNLRDDENARIE